MKTKFLITLFCLAILVAGCASKTAEQHGNGISVEFDESLGIKHLTIITYNNDKETFRENVINANQSPFEKGERVWFDTAVEPTAGSKVEFQLAYSWHIDGSEPNLTNRLDVSEANKWVNARFTEDFKLMIDDME